MVNPRVLFSEAFASGPDPEPLLVEQDRHPDGAVFGLVDPAKPNTSTRTVLAIEPSKAQSLAMGLRCVLRYDRVVHPWVWPAKKAVP